MHQPARASPGLLAGTHMNRSRAGVRSQEQSLPGAWVLHRPAVVVTLTTFILQQSESHVLPHIQTAAVQLSDRAWGYDLSLAVESPTMKPPY